MQCMVLAVMVWARVVWIHTCIVSCCHGYFILLLGNKTCNCVCKLHVWLQLRAADSPDHKVLGVTQL